MKTTVKFPLVLSSLILALAWQTLSLHASEPLVSSSNQASGGVTLSLTTSGYAFTPLIGGLIPLATGGSKTSLPPQVVTAHVELQNHTGADIPCTIFSGITFEFTVYDANDNVVWDSLPAVLPTFILRATLKAGDSFHGMVSVPLFINGKALKPGVYTLDARLYGSPIFSTTTTFVVNNVIAIN
jgi:hypothetical protein